MNFFVKSNIMEFIKKFITLNLIGIKLLGPIRRGELNNDENTGKSKYDYMIEEMDFENKKFIFITQLLSPIICPIFIIYHLFVVAITLAITAMMCATLCFLCCCCCNDEVFHIATYIMVNLFFSFVLALAFIVSIALYPIMCIVHGIRYAYSSD